MSPNANKHSVSHHPGNPCTPECTGHPDHKPRVQRLAFKQLDVGQQFEFAYQHDNPTSQLCSGPWIKTGTRLYRAADESRQGLDKVRIGSINVECVIPDVSEQSEVRTKVTARRVTGKKPKYAAFALQDDGKWKRISHWYGDIKNADDAAERYSQSHPFTCTESFDDGLAADAPTQISPNVEIVEADDNLQMRLNEEPTAYEANISRRTGVSVEQLRKEEEEASRQELPLPVELFDVYNGKGQFWMRAPMHVLKSTFGWMQVAVNRAHKELAADGRVEMYFNGRHPHLHYVVVYPAGVMCGNCAARIGNIDENVGKSLGCYGCDSEFCSAACLLSHEQRTGHSS